MQPAYVVLLVVSVPCAFGIILFLFGILMLCAERESDIVVQKKLGLGLSDSDLEKLPKVIGKDLVFANDCAVCLDEIEDGQPARMVPGCNHGFHLQCAHAWLSENPTCPVCRVAIGPELFNPPETNPC